MKVTTIEWGEVLPTYEELVRRKNVELPRKFTRDVEALGGRIYDFWRDGGFYVAHCGFKSILKGMPRYSTVWQVYFGTNVVFFRVPRAFCLEGGKAPV